MFRPQDIFYKVKTTVRSHNSFPYPGMTAEFPTSKISIAFRDNKIRMLLTVSQDSVTAEEYEYEGVSTSELVYKLGHPEDSDCNIYLDQTLEDISKTGIDKTKVSVLKIPTVEARLVAVLNALDVAFCYSLGARNVSRGLRVVA